MSVSIKGYAQQDVFGFWRGIKKEDVALLNSNDPNKEKAKINLVKKLTEEFKKITSTRKITAHIIKAKETWYGLSKHYGISIAALKKANPTITETGLQPGMTLKIPADKIPRTVIIHTVKSSETWYGIAKKYGITQEELQAKNPVVMTQGLQPGTRLKVPLPDPNAPKTEPHVLAPKETWYSLSKKYGIKIDDLQAVNPTAVKEGLKTGTTIKIPVDKKQIRKSAINTNINEAIMHRIEKELDRIRRLSDLNKNDTLWVKLSHWKRQEKLKREKLLDKPVNIDILLPFKRYQKEDTPPDELFKDPKKLPSLVLDFYLGARLALDILKKKGADVRYRTFDTANHSDTITKIFQENDFSKSNAIIGPLYSEHLQQLVDMSGKKTPIIYPIYSQKQIGFKGESIVKTAPDIYCYEKAIKNYMLKNLNGRKLIIIGDKTEESRMKNLSLQEFFKKDSVAEVEIINAEEDYLDASIFKPVVSDSIHNRSQWILINTEDTVITSDIINNIRSIYKHTNNIRLFSFRKGKNFEKIDDQMLSILSFTYATNTLHNENDKTNKYRTAFYKSYGTYPTKYAVRGFDVVYDIVTRILLPHKKTGAITFFFTGISGNEQNQFDAISNNEITTKGISHYFKYKRGLFQTLDNHAVYLLRYDTDLNLEIYKKRGLNTVE